MDILVGFPSQHGGKPGFVSLGQYIFATNPYHAVLPPEPTWSLPYPPPVIVIPKTGYKPEKLLYMLDSTGIEQQQKPGTWKFKYGEHYVERALRIPYMYYVRSERDEKAGREPGIQPEPDEQIVLVRDYLLIAFEGGGAY